MFESITAKSLIDAVISEVDVAADIPVPSYCHWLSALEQLLYSEIIREQREVKISSDESSTFRVVGAVREYNHTAISGPYYLHNGVAYDRNGGTIVPETCMRYVMYYRPDISGEYAVYLWNGSKYVKEEQCFEIKEHEDMPRFEDISAVYAKNRQLIKTTPLSQEVFPNVYYKVPDALCAIKSEDLDGNVRIVYTVRPIIKTIANYATETVKVPEEWLDMVTAKLRGEAYKVMNEDNLAAKWLQDYNVLLENFKAWVQSKAPEFGA